MDDSDKADQNPSPSDGVDDETFARAVGLDNPDPDQTRNRRRRTASVGKRSSAKQERRSKERTVVRRPPSGSKTSPDSETSPPEDVTGVVPIIQPTESTTAETPLTEATDPQVCLLYTSPSPRDRG